MGTPPSPPPPTHLYILFFLHCALVADVRCRRPMNTLLHYIHVQVGVEDLQSTEGRRALILLASCTAACGLKRDAVSCRLIRHRHSQHPPFLSFTRTWLAGAAGVQWGLHEPLGTVWE